MLRSAKALLNINFVPVDSHGRSSIYAVYPRLIIPGGGQKERAVPSSLLDLAPGGGCLAARITANAGGLLHHRFTLTLTEVRAHCFCGPADRSLRPGISPAPRPGEYGLSSIPWRQGATGPRPPDQPEAISSYTGEESASTPGFSPAGPVALPG